MASTELPYPSFAAANKPCSQLVLPSAYSNLKEFLMPTCADRTSSPVFMSTGRQKTKDTLSPSPQLKHLLYIDFIFFLQRQGSHHVPRHTNIAKTSISKPLSQGLLYFSNGFTVRDRLNSLSFTEALQDIFFLLWNTKISSLDDCFKKEAVTANKSARSVFSPVNM